VKLNVKAIQAAKPEYKDYKLADGGGLYLLIKRNGSKLWRLKYRFLGREKLLSIGSFPLISLVEAREARHNAKYLLAQHPPIDPMEERRKHKQDAIRNTQNTFQAVALEWHDVKKDNWSDGHTNKVFRLLEKNVFPYIGSRSIDSIKPPELLECLRKIEKRGALEIASKTKQICGQVFLYGIQTGKCEWNAADNLTGAMRPNKTTHHRSISIEKAPEFLKSIERNDARLFERTRRALWLSLYTFCRPVEIRKAQWEHIDIDNAIWTIPAHIMKMRRDHIVPLSRQAIELLEAQREEVKSLNSPWVFPSQHKPRNPMSDGTVNKAIKLLGYGDEMVAHGVRALARTGIRERLNYDSEIIERQLAHKASGPLGEAYDRTQFIDQRKKMMQDWSTYLHTLANTENVIHGKFG